jgi:tubulin delta
LYIFVHPYVGDYFKTWSHPRAFNNYEKSAVLLSNSQAPLETLNGVVDKAWKMFASRAYVHQYLKHGMTEEAFVDSFATSEQIVANYRKLHSS